MVPYPINKKSKSLKFFENASIHFEEYVFSILLMLIFQQFSISHINCNFKDKNPFIFIEQKTTTIFFNKNKALFFFDFL